jgi:hypothetical protein
MVDIIYFREANLNYARVNIDKPNKESSLLSGWIILDLDNSKKLPDIIKKTDIKPLDIKENNLLIYSLTLLEFSLNNKL